MKEISILTNSTLTRKGDIYGITFSLYGSEESSLINEARHYLHPYEWNQYEKYHHAKRKNSFLAGRISAKKAVGFYTGINPISFYIKNGIFNQPEIFDLNHSPAGVSISHTDELSFSVAFDICCSLGVDIEQIADPAAGYIYEYLTENEKIISHSFHPVILWAAKESLSKALKVGLTSEFTIYEIQSIQSQPKYLIISYTYFPQYKCLAIPIGNYILSISIPSTADCDISEFINKLQSIGLLSSGY